MHVRTRLHFAVPSSPPQNVTVIVLSSTKIEVNWTDVPEIDQNGIVTDYEVMYEPLMTFGNALNIIIVNTTNMYITLDGLQEFVNYNISVRARTSVGPGLFSVGIVRRTLDDGKLSLHYDCFVLISFYILISSFRCAYNK